MLLKSEWAARFIQASATLSKVRAVRLPAGHPVYLAEPQNQCWVIAAGYIKLVDTRGDGERFTRLMLGRGSLFGARPFAAKAFHGFPSRQCELAFAHGPAEVYEFDLATLEAAARQNTEFAALLLESLASRAQFLERRLLWQFTTPVRARMAAALRDMICYEGQRCRHGHTIDVRMSHQDLADLTAVARPVVSAELKRMRDEGLVEYTRAYLCVEDLAGLNRLASQ